MIAVNLLQVKPCRTCGGIFRYLSGDCIPCKKKSVAKYSKSSKGKITKSKSGKKYRKSSNGILVMEKATTKWKRGPKGKKWLFKMERSPKRRASKNKRRAERKLTDVHYYLSERLRDNARRALVQGWKAGSAVRDLGISIPEFKEYIEAKFQPGMTWANRGQWHLDHIIPLASFNLIDRAQFLQAAHYTNYQPLWATDNLRKQDKV